MVSLLVLLTVSPALTHHGAVPPANAATCEGVWVVIDARDLGGSITTSCAPGAPGSGLAALEAAGHSYSFVPRIPGMVCTIDARPQPCNGAPADAYWSYWHAAAGGSWSYATRGAGTRAPGPGTVEGWRFGDGAAPPGIQPPDNSPAPATEGDGDDSRTSTASGSDDPSSSTGAAAEDSSDGDQDATAEHGGDAAGSGGDAAGADPDGASDDEPPATMSGTGPAEGSETAPRADRSTDETGDETGDDTAAGDDGAEPSAPDPDEEPDGLAAAQPEQDVPQDGVEHPTDTVPDGGAGDAAEDDTPRPRTDEEGAGDLAAAPGDAPSEGSLPVAGLVGIGLLAGIGALTFRQGRLRRGVSP